MEPFIGEIQMFAGNYPPKGWAFCNGQIMAIAQNTALFSLLGTNFGGNGTTTFGLPNLQGRVPMHWGQGTGLSNRSIGDTGGENYVTIDATTMAPHTHAPAAAAGVGSGGQAGPANAIWCTSNGRDKQFTRAAPTKKMAARVDPAPLGGGQPHENRAPVLAVTYIIALQGVFPPRP